MKKYVALMAVLCALPLLVSAQEISLSGNRGMFRLQYAQPHNMGMFSFHLAPQERFEALDIQYRGIATTDRKHYFNATAGLSYSIVDYLEIRTRATAMMKWFEMNNYPAPERGDPYPAIGFETIEVGMKAGYPVVVQRETPTIWALGVDLYLDWGPELARTWFNNAYDCDRRMYSDSFPEAYEAQDSLYWYAPNFAPYIPHAMDIGVTGLFDFRIGPFASHVNAGFLNTGEDRQPDYVADADFRLRPNYFVHGGGIELIPSEDIRILFEAYGVMDLDENGESLWVTPGLRFGTKSVSFDLGCDLSAINPTEQDFWWRAFFNFSAGADLIKKVEVHVPLAKITGRVYDAKSGEPIAATITFPGSDHEAVQLTETGMYEISLTPGNYRLHIEAPNYRWKEQPVVLKDGDHVVFDFNLNRKEICKVTGKIYDAETKLPVVATITFPQSNVPATNSDTAGMYEVTLSPGTFRIHVEATGYQFDEKVVQLNEGDTRVVDVGLMKVSLDQATLVGKVAEVDVGTPLLAQITFVDTKIPAISTDPATGVFKIMVPAGTYVLKVEAQDYVTETAPVVLMKDETKIQNFNLRKVPKVGEKIILRGIYFDFNSAVIKPESYPVLDDAARVLNAKPTMRVEISGHTDSVGSDSYNQKLSFQRANAVRDYLITYHKIDPSRLIAVGYGETQPVADNRTKSGRDLNRRIEFKNLGE